MRTKWLALCVLLAGCGGGGSTGTVITDPVHLSLLAKVSAVNAEDINALMATYEPAFFEDCLNFAQTQQLWESRFNQPNYSYRLSNLQVLQLIYNQDRCQADIVVDVTINGNTVPEHRFRFYRLLNGMWRELGDGTCP